MSERIPLTPPEHCKEDKFWLVNEIRKAEEKSPIPGVWRFTAEGYNELIAQLRALGHNEDPSIVLGIKIQHHELSN